MKSDRTDPRTPRARALCRAMTEAERKLRRGLATLPLDGSLWRRQKPIGPYVADFACHRLRLVMEVDGAQHGFDGERRRDDARTAYLTALGYRVLRFWTTRCCAKRRWCSTPSTPPSSSAHRKTRCRERTRRERSARQDQR